MANTAQSGTPTQGLPGDMGTFSQTAIDTCSRAISVSGTGPGVSGTVFFSYFTADKTLTISQISTAVRSTVAAGLTLARCGLYLPDGSGNLTKLCQIANDTTLWNNSTSVFTRSLDPTGGFPSAFQLVQGTRYAAAIIAIATTMPFLIGIPNGNTAVLSLDPIMSKSLSGQSDLPNSVTAASLAVTSLFYWMRFS